MTIFGSLYCRYEAKLWLSHFKKFKDSKILNKILNWINKPQENKYFDINVLEVYTIYRLFFLVCSTFGLLFSGYFYCFCLPYIFIKSKLLNHVVKAVQGKCKQFVNKLLMNKSHFYFSCSVGVSNTSHSEYYTDLCCYLICFHF